MVSDLHETRNKNPKSTLLKSKSLDNFIDTSPNLINHSTDVTSPPPFYTKRPIKIQFPKFNLFLKRHHSSHQKAFKCVAYAKKERKICFQGSVKYRRVDRTVWNHITLPLPFTVDPAECKNIIRHLNSTNDKILNNLHYNKTFTLLEDHYFQERLEQNQTLLLYIN